jgi:hypothetical protein
MIKKIGNKYWKMYSCRGRCYDHNFLRFLPMICEKWHFSHKSMLWSNFSKKVAVVWAKNAIIFAKFFGEFFLNHNIGPRFLAKRQVENTARLARNEDPLPEVINKLFKPPPPTNRLNSLVLSGQVTHWHMNRHQGCRLFLSKTYKQGELLLCCQKLCVKKLAFFTKYF